MVSEPYILLSYGEFPDLTNMANTNESESSSSSPSAPFSVSYTPSLRKSSSSKLDFLYELSYILDNEKMTYESLPLINLYHAFTKSSSSFTWSIKALIKPSFNAPKEYIQNSKYSQCQLRATS